MTVRAVVFDADDTLWDTWAAIGLGLDAVVESVRERHPEIDVDADRLHIRWRALVDEHHEPDAETAGGPTLPELRRRSFAELLEDHGAGDPAFARELGDRYFSVRHGENRLFPEVESVFAELGDRYRLGLVTNGNTDHRSGPLRRAFSFRLAADEVGLHKPDPRLFAMAAAAAGCHPNEVVSVGDDPVNDVVAPQSIGCRAVFVDRAGAGPPAGVAPDAVVADLSELPAVLAGFEVEDEAAAGRVGVGPHSEPWPEDDHLDPALLSDGDRRNVVDRYRYWRHEAIVADLAARRHPFHVAVENWRHDRNIGAVVRNANAFGAGAVHIVGRRRWNRRGAMATDRYLDVHHHDTVDSFLDRCRADGLVVVAVDNVAGSVPIETVDLPERCVLVFGQEGPGLSEEVLEASEVVCAITQYGSTRSLNAGVASGIAMYAWAQRHADPSGSGWPAAGEGP